MDSELMINGLLDLAEGEDQRAVANVATKFREGLTRANPDLSPAQLSAYDTTFVAGIPTLAHAIREAQVAAASAAITAEELELTRKVMLSPDTAPFFALLRRLTPIFAASARDVVGQQGVAIHIRSTEAALNLATDISSSDG